VENLEDALYDKIRETTHGLDPEDDRDFWMPIVRECIRQMEWTRDQCADEVGGAAEDTHERITEMDIRSAPHGWEPKK